MISSRTASSPLPADQYAGQRCHCGHPVYADDEPGGPCKLCACPDHRRPGTPSPAAYASTALPQRWPKQCSPRRAGRTGQPHQSTARAASGEIIRRRCQPGEDGSPPDGLVAPRCSMRAQPETYAKRTAVPCLRSRSAAPWSVSGPAARPAARIHRRDAPASGRQEQVYKRPVAAMATRGSSPWRVRLCICMYTPSIRCWTARQRYLR